MWTVLPGPKSRLSCLKHPPAGSTVLPQGLQGWPQAPVSPRRVGWNPSDAAHELSLGGQDRAGSCVAVTACLCGRPIRRVCMGRAGDRARGCPPATPALASFRCFFLSWFFSCIDWYSIQGRTFCMKSSQGSAQNCQALCVLWGKMLNYASSPLNVYKII